MSSQEECSVSCARDGGATGEGDGWSDNVNEGGG